MKQLRGLELGQEWVEAWFHMESRGESHTGFLLHRDKLNRFVGKFEQTKTGNWQECGREKERDHW